MFLETIDSWPKANGAACPRRRSMLGCVVAGDAVRRRVEEQIETLGLEPRWVVPSARDGRRHQRLRPSEPARRRPLGGARSARASACCAAGAPRPALVVMVGTAVTVDALDADGRFLGGLILPGFGLMLRALEMGTAGLKVPTGEAVDFPTNTSDALMSGGATPSPARSSACTASCVERTGQEPALLMTGGAAVKLGAD